MIQHTDQEILAKCQQIFTAQNEKHYHISWKDDGRLKILENTPERVQIEISCMYGAPSPNLEVLTQLADFFGTKSINDDDHFSHSGCETCDYGSSYGYTLTVRPE